MWYWCVDANSLCFQVAHLQSLSRDKDEEHTQRNRNQQKDDHRRHRPLHNQPLNIWLSDNRITAECILAESNQSCARIKTILVSGKAVNSDCEWQNQPAASVLSLVEEDENKGSPKATEHGEKTENQASHARGWREVAKSFHAEKAWERIALHGLIYVILSSIKDFWVITAELFDGDSNVVCDRVWEDDFTLGAWEEESVQDLLGRITDIRASNGVSWRVGGVIRGVLWCGHEAWAWWLAVGGRLANWIEACRGFGANTAVRRVPVSLRTLVAEEGGHLRILASLFLSDHV